ncbi:Pyrimidine reductase, riboflavin biosynthesis [Streptomyces sp. DvalAA-14]|uniref:pyrimidine reductase family protein n=1 Tax=unclassified Streptomyces TaxID=2593676 RepID=UPI00081B242F|nr:MULTISPECIES: pyrimidine reductase family protein [unclassified Streptomyces]MYS24621.1 pyrimidine reductase family protein [Streptomyces sp. SID4948]SCE47808.1 Pyrimidine reductase, riboflavin biosynthesis [Streptomyces sp. DvalAA-14]
MQRLFPRPGPGATDDSALDDPLGLADAYAYPADRAAGTPYLRANMVGSLDGAARAEGRSAPLSSPADMRVFGTLRALADLILVGAETVRQEGYRPAKVRAAFAARRAAAGQPPAAAIAVVSRRLDLDFSAPLFTAPAVPTLVLTGAGAPDGALAAARAAGARVVVAGEGDAVDPARAVRELAALGFTRLLHEGGPRLLAQFAAADVLDELCLTLSPLLTGGEAPRIMNGPAVAPPSRFTPLSILEEDGFLFTRYVRC